LGGRRRARLALSVPSDGGGRGNGDAEAQGWRRWWHAASGGGALLWPEVGDETGSWAAWAKWAAKPGGLGWCRFGLASRPGPREGEASGPGQFAGKGKMNS
jgi:hypothetical protein